MQNRARDSLEIIHDAVRDRYKFEIERIKHLDDKANNLVSVSSILAALISGFAVLSLKLSSPNLTEIGAFTLFLICLSFLVVSLCYSVKAYQIRSYVIVPDAPSLIVECEKMNADKILEVLYINYTLATEENVSQNEEKVYHIEMASWFLFASIILFGVFVFLTIAKG